MANYFPYYIKKNTKLLPSIAQTFCEDDRSYEYTYHVCIYIYIYFIYIYTISDLMSTHIMYVYTHIYILYIYIYYFRSWNLKKKNRD